jgi:nitroreductase
MNPSTNYDLLKQIIQQRRSIRKFLDKPVDEADIRELIDCARYAPSDTNSQTWEFVVILDRERIKRIEQMTWDALHRRAAEAEAQGKGREARLLVKSFGPYATAFGEAPALVVCLATPYQSKFREKIFDPIGLVEEDVWREEGIKSSCLAAMNLMLAAHARGLATCPMTGPVLLAGDELREELGIDPSRQVNMVIALGHPAHQPDPLPRKEIDEILTIVR